MDDIDFTLEFKVSKHFRDTWMRKWNCDITDLRNACLEAKKKINIGKKGKYEVFIKLKGKDCKLIMNTLYSDSIYIISGAEGHG